MRYSGELMAADPSWPVSEKKKMALADRVDHSISPSKGN